MASAQKVVGLKASSGNHTLQFGLVRIDISMEPLFDPPAATRPQRHNICPEHKEQLRQAWFCEKTKHYLVNGESQKAVERDGKWVVVTDEEFTALKQAEDGTVKLTAMLPWLDPFFVERSYALWPKDKSHGEAFKLLYTLLEQQESYLMGVMIQEGTPRVFAVTHDPLLDILIGHICHYEAALRMEHVQQIKTAVDAIPAPTEEALKLADQLFSTLPAELDLAQFKDSLGERQWMHVESKAKGKKLDPAKVVEVATESDFMEALKKSVEEAKQTKQQKKPSKKGVAA